jgi:hypothetical protein
VIESRVEDRLDLLPSFVVDHILGLLSVPAGGC